MVFTKYKVIRGKRYGPYYYESIRRGNKVITRYLGTTPPARSEPGPAPTFVSPRSPVEHREMVAFLIGVTVILLFASYSLLISPTGRATVAFAPSSTAGEPLAGTMTLSLEPGEFIPADSDVLLSLGTQERRMPLAALISVAPMTGMYSAAGSVLTGAGSGYGSGTMRMYPEVSFSLTITKGASGGAEEPEGAGEENGAGGGAGDAVAPGSSESGAPEASAGESETMVEQNAAEVPPVTPQETPGAEKQEERQAEKQELQKPESGKADKGEETSAASAASLDGGITGAVVQENGEIISGSISKDDVFTYTLNAGERAALKAGSVTVQGKSVDDSTIQVSVAGNEVRVRTAYEELVNASAGMELQIDLSLFNISAEAGTLTVKVVAQGQEFVSVEEEIVIEDDAGPGEIISNGTDEEDLEGDLNATLGDFTASNVTVNETNVTTNLTANVTALEDVTLANASVVTARGKIRVGQPVVWVKNVTLETAGNVTITLPGEAENVSVKKVVNLDEDREEVQEARAVITGKVSVELELAEENRVQRFVRGIMRAFTGRVIADSEENETIEVVLTDNATEYVIEYVTDAPQAFEHVRSDGGKDVIISGPELNYTDVISFTTIPEVLKVGEEAGIRVWWQENGTYVPFTAADTGANGLLDYLEWVTPHLSNQTFNITFAGENVSNQNANNITQDNDFWHLTVSDSAPYNSLVGYWSFDGDNSTTAMDWVGGNDGTYKGNSVANSTGCIYNDCGQFDGIADNFTVADTATLDLNDNYTVLLWVRFLDRDRDQAILGKNAQNLQNIDIFAGGANDFARCQIYDGTNDATADSSNNVLVSTNVWYHIACVREKGVALRIFINGVLNVSDTDDVTGTITNNNPLTFGDRDVGTTPELNGSLDEVMIFNTNLSAAQITDIYNNQSARFKARGIVSINQTNFTSGKNYVNVTTRQYERAQGSNISLRIQEFNASGSSSLGEYQNLSGNASNTGSSNLYTISSLTTNISLDFLLLPGNGTGGDTAKSFYTPLLRATAGEPTVMSVDEIPTVTFVAPTEDHGTNISRNQILINATSADSDLANITILLYNSSGTVNETTTSSSPNFVNITGLADGRYWFNVTAADLNNYRGNTSTRNVTIDTTTPLISFGAGTEGNGTTSKPAWIYVNVSLTESNVANITFTIYNGTTLHNRTTFTTDTRTINWTGLVNGTYYFNATVTDILNQINQTETRTITVNTSNFCDFGTNETTCYITGSRTWDTWINLTNLVIRSTGSVTHSANSDALTYYINISAQNLSIEGGASISVNGKGYTGTTGTGNGPGGGSAGGNNRGGGGGGYGGAGGGASSDYTLTPGGPAYGSNTDPRDVGSGGGRGYALSGPIASGGNGGGLIILSASDLLTINGTLVAAGTIGSVASNNGAGGGGGSGGAINLLSRVFAGNGTLNASGGGGGDAEYQDGGGGGGGRIAVRYVTKTFSGTMIAPGGPVGVSQVPIAGSSGTLVELTPIEIAYIDPTPANGTTLAGTTLTMNVSANATVQSLKNVTFFVYNTTGKVNESRNTSMDYSITILNLPETTYYFNVTAWNNNSVPNWNSTATRTVVVDTPPRIQFNTGTETNGTTITRSNLVINVTATDTNLSNITVFVYNTTGAVNITLGTNAENYLNVTGLPDTTYYFNATARDGTNNYNATETRTVTIDTAPPTSITFVTPTENDGANLTRNFILVNVTATDGSLQAIVIRLYNGSHFLVNNRTNASSPHSVNFSSLSDGTYYFNATANDSVGNKNETATRTVTIDTIAPNISYGGGTEETGTNLTRSNIVINVTAADLRLANIMIVLYNATALVNQTTTTATENWVNITSLSDGTYTFNGTAMDTFGNKNETATRTVRLDTLSPTITFVAPTPEAGAYVTSLSINVTGADANLQNITIRLYNASSALNRSNTSTVSPFNLTYGGLTDGLYLYNATVADQLNNLNHTTTRNVTVDGTNPQISYQGATEADGVNVTRSWIFVNVTVTEVNEANITFTLYNASGAYNVTTFANGGRSINWTGLADGTYTFNVTVVDRANQRNTTATRTVTVDTTVPGISYTTGTEADGVNKSQSFVFVNVSVTEVNEVNITFTLYNATAAVNITTFGAGNRSMNWSGLAAGNYTYNVSVTDRANQRNTTQTRSIKLDAVAAGVAYGTGTETNGSTVSRTFAIVNVTASDNLAGVANMTVFWYNGSQSLLQTNVSTGTELYLNFSGLTNGTYYFNATAVDWFGNRNYTQTRQVSIDTDALTLVYESPTEADGVNLTRTTILVNVTVTNRTTLQALVVRLYNASRAEINSTTNTTANVVFGNYSSLSDGRYYFNATGNDTDGYHKSLATRTVLIDTTRPGIGFGAETAGNYVNVSRAWVYVNLSLNETNIANVTFTLWNQSARVNETVYAGDQRTFNWTLLSDATYTYNVTVTDVVNFRNTTESRGITLDTTYPLVVYGAGTPDDGGGNNANWVFVNVTVTEANEANITFTLWNQSALVNQTTFATSVRSINWTSLADGNYTFNVSVVDFAGNRNITSTRTVTVDTLPPSSIAFVNVTEEHGAILQRNNIVVNVTASDLTLRAIVIRLYNGTNVSVANRTNSSSPHAVNFSNLGDGRYFFNATANDSGGNENWTGTRSVVVDTQPPAVSAMHSDDVVQYGNATLQVNATDAGSGLQAGIARLFYANGTPFGNYTMTLNATSGSFNLTLWNLSVIADYDVNYTLNDSLGRETNASDYFEVYRSFGITLRGNVTDADGNLRNYSFVFRRPETNITLLNFTNSSYSFALDEMKNRTYDLEITVNAHKVFLPRLSIPEAYIPVNVDNLTGATVNISLYKVLGGLGVNSTYQGNATLNLSYTYDSDGAAVTESGLTVHRCTDWNYTDQVCNGAFALYGNKTVVADADRIIVNVTSFSAYLVTEYTCGNGVCSAAYGETTSTCATDCAAAGGGGSSGGGGGGGGGAATTPKATQGTLQVSLTKIERQLTIGEQVMEQLTLLNTKTSAATVTLSVDKRLRTVLQLPGEVVVQPGDSVAVPIIINGTREGVYQGNLYITSADFNNSIPVEITVLSKEQKLLDISVAVLKERIAPGKELPFKVEIFNLGQEKRYDLVLSYDVVNKETNDTLIHKEEQTGVAATLSVLRSLELPADAPTGEYRLIVTADYGEGKAQGFASFVVRRSFVTADMSKYASLVLMVVVVSFILFLGMYYLVSLRRQLKAKAISEKLKNSVYPAPDFLTLPQSGYAYVGLIADADEKAYLDHTQLNRHTLIAGGTGCGKTVAAMDIVEELLKKGVGVVVFDPVGQWTGFAKKNADERMRRLYPKFKLGLPQSYNPRVIEISDATMHVDVAHYLQGRGLTVLRMDRLSPKKVDMFIEGALGQIYRGNLGESGSLKSLVVLDEVHRLLPKYGGRKAYTKLEQAVREFRKWGIGLLMISQVLTDFKGAIRGNIGTEIQMHTRYEGDIKRVRERHGAAVSKLISKLPTGLGLVECADYNKGNPYFIEFRPLLHSPYKLMDKEAKSLVRKETPVLRMEQAVRGEAGTQSGGKHVRHRTISRRTKKRH